MERNHFRSDPASSPGGMGAAHRGGNLQLFPGSARVREPSAVSGLSQGPPEPVSWLLPAPKLTPRGTTKDLISLSVFSIWEAELRMTRLRHHPFAAPNEIMDPGCSEAVETTRRRAE